MYEQTIPKNYAYNSKFLKQIRLTLSKSNSSNLFDEQKFDFRFFSKNLIFAAQPKRTMADSEKLIDVRKIITDKNPKLLNVLPDFAINYLKRIIHEDEVNEFIAKNKGVGSIEFCNYAIDHFNIELTNVGLENIPETGKCILAVNHPLGGMDAMALVTILKEKRTDIKFIVNDVLLKVENMQDMFVGVNKMGKTLRESLRKVDELFATDQLICVFPAGLVSRKKRGIIKDLEWKKTFISRAKKYNTPIVPAHINGELTNFFYRLANIRAMLGVKANIEMLYLADEMFQQRNKKMRVAFGTPIEPSILDKSKSDLEWAQHIKEIVYQLAEK